MKNHMKIQKLPQIFKAIIDKGIDVGFNLNKISYITIHVDGRKLRKL